MRHAGAAREVPPPLEMLCLRALWTLGEGNVKAVQEAVAGTRTLAYTTVMTVLDRLARRGVISRRKVGRAFLYTPLLTRNSVQRRALKEFLEGYFDGSAEQLLELLRHPEPGASAEPARAEARLDTALL
ncbi:MAG TPA: BlaI/MecI/CopY family transcriptional regulator [Bryobacteraceae bacterium]|nr:BlaI/MecI/CopY family transcriptional regulator [Bryobacteraceae bacterium]